jgi:hypothetical protein
MLTEIKIKKEGGVGFGCRWAWRRWVGFREKRNGSTKNFAKLQELEGGRIK